MPALPSGLLRKTRDQLKLSLDEMYRLENEGGNPVSRQQTKQTEDMHQAIKAINNLLSSPQYAM